MSRWILYDPDFYDEIVPLFDELVEDEEEERVMTCRCYGRGKKLSEVEVPRVPQLHFRIEKERYIEKIRLDENPKAKRRGRGRAKVRQLLTDDMMSTVGQPQGDNEKEVSNAATILSLASKNEDAKVNRDKARKKKTKKIPKTSIMNCVVSYDTDGNTVISKDEEIGDGSIALKCPENKCDVQEKGKSAKKEDRNAMAGYNSTENNAVEIELQNNLEKIGRLLLTNEHNDEVKSNENPFDHSKYPCDRSKDPCDHSKDFHVIKVPGDDTQVAEEDVEDLRVTKNTELNADTEDPDAKTMLQERVPYNKHVYIKPPRFIKKENEKKMTSQMKIGPILIKKASETTTTATDLPQYLVTTTASITTSFSIPNIPPPACNVSSSNMSTSNIPSIPLPAFTVSSSNMPPYAIPSIPPPACNVSSSNIPPYALSSYIPNYSGSPTYMMFWPYQMTAPPSTTMLHSTTTQSTDTVSYSANDPSYQTVQALASRDPHMATSPISTANHGLASPQSLTQIPVPPKFDFLPPFIPTTTPSLPGNQSHYLPPNFSPMPQQFTEHQQQHPAFSVPIVPRNSPYNTCVPPVAYPSLPSPNVKYPFQNQPVYVIGYFVNPNTCNPKVDASPVQSQIPPDCNTVCVTSRNIVSYNGSNGSNGVLPATTSS